MKNKELTSSSKKHKKSWKKPEIKVLGDAKNIIKEAKFAGFSDGVTFNGNPIGESS
tara:strand:- start:239 stop:406 length:168 start_codon:yes stop_codon:yes gene_type:complete